jgi:hypothetical protein
MPGVKPKETKAEKLQKQLKATAEGLLNALREARRATDPKKQQAWLTQARRYKAYIEKLGKNK